MWINKHIIENLKSSYIIHFSACCMYVAFIPLITLFVKRVKEFDDERVKYV